MAEPRLTIAPVVCGGLPTLRGIRITVAVDGLRPSRYTRRMASPHDIFAGAMRLPTAQRVKLARELLQSLDGGSDVDAEAAWLEEIRRRMAEVDAGSVELKEWPTVRESIAAGLKRPLTARTSRARAKK